VRIMEIATKTSNSKQLSFLADNSDALMAGVVAAILVFMIIPLPAILLDLLLTLNITFSLLILLVGIYITKPLEFSSFPSILLIVTLFRLSLNIASTRLILLHGNEGGNAAGNVIHAFGNFVVGGNYLVGLIIFLILVIINFVVITKGAGRVAEVAARFTLDAMPGKQMSIDADLNAGLINEHEAKSRRAEISQEAEYYGSMDGANKFVRGDAIAGIIITVINIIAGLTIGIFQNSMSFGSAVENYTLLTVGDGLVTQMPALIVSTAAGIIVTRAGSAKGLGREIFSQILVQPKAIATVSILLGLFAIVPGLPTLPFIILAIVVGVVAYFVFQTQKETQDEKAKENQIKEEIKPVEKVGPLPPVDILGLEIGYALIPLVDMERKGVLLDRIKSIRHQMVQEIGIVVPPIHIQDNMHLKPGEYSITLKGNKVAEGILMPDYFLAMNPGNIKDKINGIPTTEPTFGLPAFWIKEKDKDEASSKGYTVVDLSTVLATHLSDIIKNNAYELLGRQEVQQLLDKLKESNPKVVEELVPNLLPLGNIVKILQNLLKEHVPVRDLLTILECLADWAPSVKDVNLLTEHVRESLSRTITKLYQDSDGKISVITLEHDVEKAISEAVRQTEVGSFLAIEPEVANNIMESVSSLIKNFSSINQQPVVLCSAQIRFYFKKLAERFFPDLVVLSYNDILSNLKIQSIGTAGISNAN